MIELKQTETFRKWRTKLKDHHIRAIVASRLDRLAQGNAGDVQPVGKGIITEPAIASIFTSGET